MHSSDARCTGAAHSHRTAHVLINMAPTVLSISPSRARPSSLYTSQVNMCWMIALHSYLSYSFLLWSLLWCRSPWLCLSDSSLSRHLSRRLLSGMWCGLIFVVPVLLHTSGPQMCAEAVKTWLEPAGLLILSGVLFVRFSSFKTDLLQLIALLLCKSYTLGNPWVPQRVCFRILVVYFCVQYVLLWCFCSCCISEKVWLVVMHFFIGYICYIWTFSLSV